MRSVTATWFECKIAFEKVMEDGLQKKVTEKYVVNALSHSEAEERITEEMSAYISGEFEVKGIVPAQYKEIFFMSMGEKMVAGQTEDLLHAVKSAGWRTIPPIPAGIRSGSSFSPSTRSLERRSAPLPPTSFRAPR